LEKPRRQPPEIADGAWGTPSPTEGGAIAAGIFDLRPEIYDDPEIFPNHHRLCEIKKKESRSNEPRPKWAEFCIQHSAFGKSAQIARR
jgi:hypothetical protein